jgi:hypothetical protein
VLGVAVVFVLGRVEPSRFDVLESGACVIDLERGVLDLEVALEHRLQLGAAGVAVLVGSDEDMRGKGGEAGGDRLDVQVGAASVQVRKLAEVASSTVRRGYGSKHKALRKRWASAVERGGVSCARCGRQITPGTPWDLRHDDHDRTIYVGPEHRRCNRRTATHRAGQRRFRSVYEERDVIVSTCASGEATKRVGTQWAPDAPAWHA